MLKSRQFFICFGTAVLLLFLNVKIFASNTFLLTKPLLYRLDETFWSFRIANSMAGQEIRILTPQFNSRTLDYQLACYVAQAFHEEQDVETIIKNGIDLSKLQEVQREIRRKWEVVNITQTWLNRFQGAFFHHYEFNQQPIHVFEVKASSFYDKFSMGLKRIFHKIKGWIMNNTSITDAAENFISYPWLKDEWQNVVLQEGLFTDAFTKLATQAFQTVETPFVSEKDCKGSFCFVLKDGQLRLEPIINIIKSSDKTVENDISAAIEAYRTFLKKVFGWRILDGVDDLFSQELQNYPSIFSAFEDPEEQFFGYLRCTIGIDFDKMLAEKIPLLPDHVFKCNIAANNLEMVQVESLFLRLVNLFKSKAIQDGINLNSPENFLIFLENLRISSYFSLREIRGIYCSFQKGFSSKFLTSTYFKDYLSTFQFIPGYNQPGYGEKIRELTPSSFHKLMQILFVDTNLVDYNSHESVSPEKFFTGRKIIHLAIGGYKTMGDKKTYDPTRNLFELLHIFKPLSEKNNGYLYEILAHVVVKKSLWSHYPVRPIEQSVLNQDRERRVARLIPFPNVGEEKRWYYVDGLLDDGGGDLNYVLVPACKGYLDTQVEEVKQSKKKAPLIKLYRSTASDPEAENSIDSLLADLNPKYIGSLDFEAGDEYEMAYFSRCTMPLWVGYLIIKNVEKAVKAFNENYCLLRKPLSGTTTKDEKVRLLTEFITWQMIQLCPKDVVFAENQTSAILSQFITKVGQAKFDKFMTQSLQAREWEKQKISQDIYFVGHSLGGALSQSGLFHFGPKQERIPLYGCHYKCWTFDTPGITFEESEQFLQFGREHQDLLQMLHQRWEIHYQFEYEDFVPQGGDCFLGAYGYRSLKDDPWLKIEASICKPLSSSHDLALTTMKTHLRRFMQAQQSVDYARNFLEIEEMSDLKTDWLLSSELRKKFGYTWSIPRVSELLRRTIPGTFAFTYFWMKKKAISLASPQNSDIDKDGVVFCTYKGKGIPRGYSDDPFISPDLVQLEEVERMERAEYGINSQ